MENVLIVVAWLLSVIAALFIGGYFKSYLSKKGENLATHEDIEMLIDQVAAVTKTTKQIEAEISCDVWDRRKQWELKREVLLQTARRVSAAVDALSKIHIAIQTLLKLGDNPGTVAVKNKANEKWFKVARGLQESRVFVSVTCDQDVLLALDQFVRFCTKLAAKINNDDNTIYIDSTGELMALNEKVQAAIRKELGIDNGPPL